MYKQTPNYSLSQLSLLLQKQLNLKNQMSATGPNALNMNAYTQGQDDSYAEEEQASVEGKPTTDLKPIEQQFDQFIENMQKYDKILSEVAKNIDQINTEDHFITDFYPDFITESVYHEDQEKKIVASTDPELAQIIHNLEKHNKVLKEEIKGWVFEFAKKTKLTEVLISENKLLRKSITGKNKEIVKLIEGIAKADNEEIIQLVEDLNLLKEENGVLLDHLNQIKEQISQTKDQDRKLQEALDQAKLEHLESQHKQVEAQDQEEHYSKMYELLQSSKDDLERKKRKLEKEKTRLTQINKEYLKEQDQIEKELRHCEIDKEDIDKNLKNTYKNHEIEKYQLMEQIHDLGEKISKQKQQSRFYDSEIIRNNDRAFEYENLTKDYQKKVEENQQKLKETKKELASAQTLEVNAVAEIDLNNFDIERMKAELEELISKQKTIQEESKQELKELEEYNTKQTGEWSNRVAKEQRELAMRILQEKSEVSIKQNQVKRWEQKIYQKKEEIVQFKTQLKEIKENQIRVAELKSKLKGIEQS